jgi:glucose/arabinose dehydrogenase
MKYPLFLLSVLFLLASCSQSAAPTALPATVDEVEPTIVLTEVPVTEPVIEPAEEPTAEANTPTTAPTAPAAATGRADAVGLALVAEGFTAPVALVPVPDDSGRLFVADQTGVIRIIAAGGEVLAEPFLDIRERLVALDESYDERGLLGLAFHPDYVNNGRFFVYYSAPLRAEAPSDWNHTSHLSAFSVSADNPDAADPGSEQILLQIDQPQPNHNAGHITFGPDGYLYVPLGDGGSANDTGLGHVEDWYEANEGGNGQSPQNWLGSILRIDVDNQGAEGQAYAIPGDNPFVGDDSAAGETWAFGFRNPYRIAFDKGGNNALFVGDAGQNLWEEVSIVERGGNYGWNVKEGSHCFSTTTPSQSPAECPDTDPAGRPLVDPIIEYPNAAAGGPGLVVIGGAVYRGSAMPQFDGHYIFGDWSTTFGQGDGTLFAATPANEGEMWPMRELTIATSENGRLNAFLLSFGQDNEGEIYVLTSNMAGPAGSTGAVYRLIPAEAAEEG